MVATEPLPVSQSARPARHLVAVGTELEVLQARPRASRMAAVESLHCGWHACDGESAAAVFLPPVYPDGPARRLDASFQLVLSAAPVECGVLHLPVSSTARVDLRRQPRRRHHRLDERYAQSESWVDFDAAPRLSAARPVRNPRVSRSPRLGRTAVLALVYAMIALASFPPLLLGVFGITTVYVLVAIILGDAPRARVGLLWTGAVLLGLGLVAFYYGSYLALREMVPEVAKAYRLRI